MGCMWRRGIRGISRRRERWSSIPGLRRLGPCSKGGSLSSALCHQYNGGNPPVGQYRRKVNLLAAILQGDGREGASGRVATFRLDFEDSLSQLLLGECPAVLGQAANSLNFSF